MVSVYGIILPAEVKQSEDSMPNKPWKESLLALFYEEKKMLWTLSTAVAQVKVGNTSENFLNESCQIIYILYWAKKKTIKVYNNIIKSI